jgi:hypothetical protein
MKRTEAGLRLEERLQTLGLTTADLIRELNRRRAALGIQTRVASNTIRRWTIDDAKEWRRINIDDATLIQVICGLPVIVWSCHTGLFAPAELVAHGVEG